VERAAFIRGVHSDPDHSFFSKVYPKIHKVTSQNTESVTTNSVPVQLITPNSHLAEPECTDYQYEAYSSFLNASIPMKHGGSFRNFPIQFPP